MPQCRRFFALVIKNTHIFNIKPTAGEKPLNRHLDGSASAAIAVVVIAGVEPFAIDGQRSNDDHHHSKTSGSSNKKKNMAQKPETMEETMDVLARAEVFDYHAGICYYCCTQLQWQDFSKEWTLTYTHKGRTGIPTTVIALFAPTCLSCDRRVATQPLRKGGIFLQE
ncbi:hypothetical protein NTE_00477 [Candidatus Nitrososphaera evergladensis SR1]|uniref:Uncharacterized protein n=1 Tax=Candidatus Nitrososphaera evergladensis SR1 TaxID=1459636 RepID=A0A075MMQ5_9ARCH|nr:hypothetical protein [Candidatus Nitrososphaera evergladensis]AIF82558.1 hypothetical protein NTE_00477 [Candidatus Nitrososphaera evergladensis SR1]